MAGKRDVWLTDYDALTQQAVSIREKINERNQMKMSGGNPSKLSSSIRLMLNGYARDLAKLKTSLSRASSSYHITEGEAMRRQNLVDNLTARQRQLNDAFREEPSQSRGSSRDALLGSQPIGVSTNPWLDDEPEETQGLTNTELVQQHQEVMKQQDEGLEELAKAVQRQKHIGLAMHDEVEQQDEILDDLNDKVGRTTARIERETRHVDKIRVKASDKGLCCAVTLLFLLIVVLMIIPKT